MTRYEYKVIDTGKHIEEQLNDLGAQGWRVVGVTTKKQMSLPRRRPSSSCARWSISLKPLEFNSRERPLGAAIRV